MNKFELDAYLAPLRENTPYSDDYLEELEMHYDCANEIREHFYQAIGKYKGLRKKISFKDSGAYHRQFDSATPSFRLLLLIFFPPLPLRVSQTSAPPFPPGPQWFCP